MNKKHLTIITPFILAYLLLGVDGLECLALIIGPCLMPIMFWAEDL
jgi:hypothetical protein